MSEDRPYTVGQIMGLVVALRLVCAGVVVFLLTAMAVALTWQGEIPSLLSYALLLSFYLFAVGNVLLVFRVLHHSQRLMLLAPLAALAPLAQEGVRDSLPAVCLILAAACALYFEGLRQESSLLSSCRGAALLRRLQILVPVCAGLAPLAPRLALGVSAALVPGFFFACQLWLKGLRAESRRLEQD